MDANDVDLQPTTPHPTGASEFPRAGLPPTSALLVQDRGMQFPVRVGDLNDAFGPLVRC